MKVRIDEENLARKMGFEILTQGERKTLEDPLSDANTHISVKAEDVVCCCQPEKMIKDADHQRKCDWFLYAASARQACFFEFKGTRIKEDKGQNPYDQIVHTMQYFKGHDALSAFVGSRAEKQAFVVSPGRQTKPAGGNSRERRLWQELAKENRNLSSGGDAGDGRSYLHYVRVVPSGSYSDKGDTIICPSNQPLSIPYRKN